MLIVKIFKFQTIQNCPVEEGNVLLNPTLGA